uniref:C3H1-type domain-containing protein n=1 Tax=Caenorhabditis tropicalis TaxID=1561998 RepID=A0A1I7USH3_9PELO
MVAKNSPNKTSYLSVLQFDQHEVGFSTVVDGEGRDKTSFVIEDLQWHFAAQDHVLSCYKTEQCRKPARLCRQGYACPFYHNSKDRRRPPALYKYRSTPCPAAKTIDEWLDPDICEAGDNCQYCHTRTEQQFHPEIYKSTKCNDMLEHGYCPRAVFCAFAHHDSELHAQRNPYVGSTQPSPKEQCSPSPNGFSIPTEQIRFESPINGISPSYSSVLKTRVPIKQGYATTDSISSSYPKAPGYERSPIVGSFEFGRGDQRLRTHSLNMGQLDMFKRNMILSGGLQGLDSGNPALTSHSSLCRSDSGFNVVNDTSLATLDELSLDLPRIEEVSNHFNLFNDAMSSVRNASLDPYNNPGFFNQQEPMPNDIFGATFEHTMFPQEYPQDGYNDYMKPIKNEDFGSLNEKCQYLEEAFKQMRQTAEMWRMRFEGECLEKNRLLAERSNLMTQIEQLKLQNQIPQSPFMPPVQMGSPLSISLPQDNYDGGIRPSASLQHSPPYNIFGNDCDTGAPACARCGRDRSRSGFDSQSSCPVCSN